MFFFNVKSKYFRRLGVFGGFSVGVQHPSAPILLSYHLLWSFVFIFMLHSLFKFLTSSHHGNYLHSQMISPQGSSLQNQTSSLKREVKSYLVKNWKSTAKYGADYCGKLTSAPPKS